jgi:hypothetical protein
MIDARITLTWSPHILWHSFLRSVVSFANRKMICITRYDVPEYLRTGKLYASLCSEDVAPFQVPSNATKRELKLYNLDGLRHLLESLRYWIVIDPPETVVEYLLNDTSHCAESWVLAKEFEKDLPYLCTLSHIMEVTEVETRLGLAISSGYTEIIDGVVKLCGDGSAVEWTREHFGSALATGRVECVECVLRYGCPHNTTSASCRTRSVACLEYVLAHCPDYRVDFDSYASDGKLDIVEFLLAHGYKWRRGTLKCCAANNRLPMIRYLYELGCREWTGVTTMAVHRGFVQILKYAHEHGAPWDAQTCGKAANSAGGLKCLAYAHEHGCPWDAYTLCRLAMKGAFECFKYALQHDCPYTVDVATAAAKHSLPSLQYLRDHGYPWDPQACMTVAIHLGLRDLLVYLRSEDVAWPADALRVITLTGTVPFLHLAHDNGLPFDCATASALATHSNSLDHLKFLHEHGCPWDHVVVFCAAYMGFLDCLQYALLHGCPVVPVDYDNNALGYLEHPLFQAALRGQVRCVNCLLEHGHKLQLSTKLLEAVKHEGCRELLRASIDALPAEQPHDKI